MCANFQPPPIEQLRAKGFVIPEGNEFRPEVYPGQIAPVLTSLDPQRLLMACFGLVPHWAEPKLARMTYNARSETVATKPSFRTAWRQAQLALVPMRCFFEPCYESGKATKYLIARQDGEVFWAAALWERRLDDSGPARWSFTLLTINATDHPLMQRMHGPEDEKRSIVILPDEAKATWLNARTDSERRSMLDLFEPEAFIAQPVK